MKSSLILLFSIIFLFFLLQSTYAASVQIPGWDFAANALSIVTGMPTSFFDSFPEFLYHFLLPFLMIWFICLGFMKQLRIFTRAPNWIDWFISFSMAALTVYPTGWFLWIVTNMARLSGVWATVIYFIMFIAGVFLYAVRWFAPQTGVYHHLNQLKKDEKEILRAMDQQRRAWVEHGGNLNDARFTEQMRNYHEQLDTIRAKRKTIIQTIDG